MADTVTGVWAHKTLTGMTLDDAYARLDKDLGDRAYSNIFGTDFTDIKPSFAYDLLAQVFGPCGVGWGFTTVETSYVCDHTYTTKKGQERTEYVYRALVKPWFATEDGERHEWGPVPGGSKNTEHGWAEQGAVTNAVGKGFSFLGMQRHIYQNGEPVLQPEEKVSPVDEAAFSALIETAEKSGHKTAVFAKLGKPSSKAKALAAYAALDTEARAELERIAQPS